jgi:hypothetical protein
VSQVSFPYWPGRLVDGWVPPPGPEPDHSPAVCGAGAGVGVTATFFPTAFLPDARFAAGAALARSRSGPSVREGWARIPTQKRLAGLVVSACFREGYTLGSGCLGVTKVMVMTIAKEMALARPLAAQPPPPCSRHRHHRHFITSFDLDCEPLPE